jgi:hypothetical protein
MRRVPRMWSLLRRRLEELGVAADGLGKLRVHHDCVALFIGALDLEAAIAELLFGEAGPTAELRHHGRTAPGTGIGNDTLTFIDLGHSKELLGCLTPQSETEDYTTTPFTFRKGCLLKLCRGRDSNSHTLRYTILSRARLPFRHPGLMEAF